MIHWFTLFRKQRFIQKTELRRYQPSARLGSGTSDPLRDCRRYPHRALTVAFSTSAVDLWLDSDLSSLVELERLVQKLIVTVVSEGLGTLRVAELISLRTFLLVVDHLEARHRLLLELENLLSPSGLHEPVLSHLV